MRFTDATLAGLLALGIATGAPAAKAEETSLTFGIAGIPPVFVTTQQYVAANHKFFDKYGVKVTLRPFDSGAAAARAVVAGDIDVAISPTPLVVNMISNAKVDLAAIYGNAHSDYLIGSIDPSITKCEQLQGMAVGVDSVGGARSIALSQMLRPCNLKADQTQQVALATNVGQAMISGQLKVGVLHIDDVPIIEEQTNKKIITIVNFGDVVKQDHYMSVIAPRKKIAANRDAYVRMVAALIDAQRFMNDKANLEAVAADASPTGRTASQAKWSIEHYVAMDFWPKDSGLDKADIDATIKAQLAVQGIRANATPVTYEQYIDGSIYDDAKKLLK